MLVLGFGSTLGVAADALTLLDALGLGFSLGFKLGDGVADALGGMDGAGRALKFSKAPAVAVFAGFASPLFLLRLLTRAATQMMPTIRSTTTIIATTAAMMRRRKYTSGGWSIPSDIVLRIACFGVSSAPTPYIPYLEYYRCAYRLYQ